MSYSKQNFTTGQVLTAEHLNNIEKGIVANENAIAEKQPKGDYATEGFVTDKIAEAQLGGNGTNVDLSAYAKTEDIAKNYQPKGNYLTEHQKLKTINGESITGDGNISIGEPSDEQVESSVSAWLDEHPDAVAVTDKKMSDTSENAVANKTIKSYFDYSAPISYTTKPGYVKTDGQPTTATFTYTNFIDVRGLSKIAISGKTEVGAGALFLAYYTDADFSTFMGADTAIEITLNSITYEDEFLNIPEGANYVVFSSFKSLEIRLPFKMFVNEVHDFMDVKNAEVTNLLTDVATMKDTAVSLSCGKNLFNKNTITPDKILNTSNGVTVLASEGAFYSDFMEVDGGLSYIASGAQVYWMWYDENKQFIDDSAALQTAVAPNEAKYLRIDVFGALNKLDTIQIEVGESPTLYEEYRNAINYRDIDISLNLPFRVVSKDGRYGYKSIASAVKSINDGGIIYVLPGEYEEIVQCAGKKIHIIGTSADECILWNSTGLYAECPLFQSAGSIRNMTIKAIRDPEKTYTEEGSYAIHIDTYGKDSSFEIENCIIHSEFGSALGCGATPGHILTLKNNIITAKGNNNCFAYHLGAKESSAIIRFIGNYIRHFDGNTEIQFQRGAGEEDNTERINVLAINNAVKRVNLVTPQYVLDEYSFGNSANTLNYTE